MRLIDADALSELVKEPIDVFLSRLDLKCPPIIDLEPHWIPVSERLPEEDLTDVLLLYHDKRCGCEDDYYIMQAYTVRGQWRPALRIDDSDMDGLEQVAWMPLPAPYKEGEK